MSTLQGRAGVAALAAIWLHAAAADPAPNLAPAAPIPAAQQISTPQPPAPAKTGKERLSDKASDEQRVDNCKVPLAKRGTKVRPDTCETAPTN